MPDTPPRLASADPGSQSGYAPISWTAVAGLAVAGLFVLLVAVMGLTAYNRRLPLIEPWLLALPAFAVVLAFVARRQISASEGTRTGEVYANAGWWIALVAGLGYAAYLGAIEFAIRRDAEAEFGRFAAELKALDPADPKDPHLYAALYLTLPPGEAAAFSPKDTAAIDRVRANEVAGFRQLDVVQVCGRNRGAVDITAHGLKDWQQKPTEITCTLTGAVVSPEGEHALTVPMKATVDEKKVRRWQITVPPDGFVTGRSLTRYGWLVAHLDATGRQFAQEFLNALGRPGGAAAAFLGFVQPGWEPKRAGEVLNQINATGPQRAGVAGAAAVLLPSPPGAADYLTGQVFAKPDGSPLSAEDRDRLLFCWTNPGRVMPGGGKMTGSPDRQPVLSVAGGAVEMRFPIELFLAGDAASPVVAKGRMVFRVPADADPGLAGELNAARESGGASARTDTPPADLKDRRVPWRVVRIESDLRPVPIPKPSGGPPGR